MNKLVLIGLLNLIIFSLEAQTNSDNSYNDVITLQTGEDIRCKVLEVGISEIKFQKAGITPIYTIRKSDVFSITYPNGTKDVFNNSEEEMAEEENDDEYIENLYVVGKEDAAIYYDAKNCGAGGTVFTTLLVSPLFGLIPAIACASSEPSMKNLNIPEQDPSIGGNRDYIDGYTDQAHDIKKHKIWTGYWISTLVYVLVGSIVLTAQ